jgi:sorbitol-specific phosphotransferase system component IIA
MPHGETPSPVRPLASWVPAGWYPDPLGQGRARYWDGKRWTLEIRDDPPPQPVPSTPSEVPVSPPSAAAVASGSTRKGPRSARDRWRESSNGARIAIVAGAVIVLLIIIAAASGSGGNKKKPTEAAGAAAIASTPTASTPATPPVGLRLDTGDYSVTSSHTTLHGAATKGATVTVEGQHADVHGTHWSKTVALEIGGNNLTVEATLAGREPATQTISVTRHHTQAELEAKAQARKENERKEREQREVEERKEREQREIEDATPSQQNALHEAESYLQTSAFSEAGLIDQLSSEAGSQFPHADAVWAVEHLHVNWNEQAVKEAKSYLSTSSFSCQGLIDQLSSEAGSQFTLAQAEYAVHRVGLC